MSFNQTNEGFKLSNGPKMEDCFLDEKSSIPSSIGLTGFSPNGFVDYNLQKLDCDFNYNPVKTYGANMYSNSSF